MPSAQFGVFGFDRDAGLSEESAIIGFVTRVSEYHLSARREESWECVCEACLVLLSSTGHGIDEEYGVDCVGRRIPKGTELEVQVGSVLRGRPRDGQRGLPVVYADDGAFR